MKYGLLVGWGIVIYAVMFLVWSGFVIYGFTAGVWPRACLLLLLIALAMIAGRSLRFDSWADIAPYSVFWAVVTALLDAVFILPFSGWQMYHDPGVWFEYALIVLVPLSAPWLRRITTAEPRP